MKINNFIYLFNNFIGGADDDGVYKMFNDLNLNDLKQRRIFIKKELYPFFQTQFNEDQKLELKNELSFLFEINPDIDREINNQLFPFEFPQNKTLLYQDIKSILYD